jgi:polar amino acid transport system substrate-binding protein
MTGPAPTSAPPRRRAARRLVTAVLAAALGLTAACAAEAGTRGTRAAGPVFDTQLHDRLPAQVRRAGVLTVATDASYAPASFFAPDGRTVVGFEPDLAAAVGRLLGVRVRFVVTDFVRALGDVEADRVDVVMSAMTDTGERERQADFVNYFSAGTSVLVQRGNPHGITDIEDLCGEVVAVERGTVQVELLERTQSHCDSHPIDVRAHRTNADALVELRTGRAAAVLNDYPPAAYLSTNPQTQAYYQLASTVQYEPGLYGVAVPKDEPRLRDALQAAFERLLSTGHYRRILRSWDVADGAVDQITVNAG